MASLKTLKETIASLRKHALACPEAVEDHPWGEIAFKVKGKIFVASCLNEDEVWLNVSMKLPVSGTMALTLPFATPTPYGLGKHGWVTLRFNSGDEAPMDMLLEWMDESFRAVAPKRVVAKLEVPSAKSVRKKSV
ncbi:MAG: MmcQ/YjbR family DNA-binding protein [Planctomycetes bacterium]|nr:MmcQ/YjbR family DNA-binding protein [Planctomycetota bacterium]